MVSLLLIISSNLNFLLQVVCAYIIRSDDAIFYYQNGIRIQDLGMTWRKLGFGFFVVFCSYWLTNIRINLQKQHKSSLLKCNSNKQLFYPQPEFLEASFNPYNGFFNFYTYSSFLIYFGGFKNTSLSNSLAYKNAALISMLLNLKSWFAATAKVNILKHLHLYCGSNLCL